VIRSKVQISDRVGVRSRDRVRIRIRVRARVRDGVRVRARDTGITLLRANVVLGPQRHDSGLEDRV
jgi:hypothetical protein